MIVAYNYCAIFNLTKGGNMIFKKIDWSNFLTEWERIEKDYLERYANNITYDGKNTKIEYELAGASKEDIKITVKTLEGINQLMITGKDRRGKIFNRSNILSEDSQIDNITSTYKDGLLTIIIPRKSVVSNEIKIPIN
jgi:HSP20 family molecular chaperone IbpA